MRAKLATVLCLLACLGAVALAQAETVQRTGLRLSFQGKLSPHALPRQGTAPVRASVGVRIAATDGGVPPQLRQIEIAINKAGRFDTKGLPVCEIEDVQPTTTADALAACGDALVGQGHFSAKVLLRGQAPFPSEGKVHAFNARIHGHPAILAHVYGTEPAPASYTIPFELRPAKGLYGTRLLASLPKVTSDSGYVTGLSLTLGRNFSHGGKRHSYISAGCPAPKGFPGASFTFARAQFGFEGGRKMGTTLTRSCGVR